MNDRIVELGSALNKKRPDSIGVDRKPLAGVNVVADLRGMLPFKSDSVDRLLAFSVIEHVPDAPSLIGECHRILRTGGELWIKTPSPDDPEAWEDPTHLRPYPREAIRFFLSSHEKNYYFDFGFRTFQEEFDVTGTRWVWSNPCVKWLGTRLGIPLLRRGYQRVFILRK